MGFLSWIAEWFRNHVPIVGEYIAFAIEAIESSIDSLLKPIKAKLSSVYNWFLSVKSEINRFLQDPSGYIKKHIGGWVRSLFEAVDSALRSFKRWAEPKIRSLIDFINSIDRWLEGKIIELKDFIWSKIKPHVKPYLDFIRRFRECFSEFLKDPKAYISNIVASVINSVLPPGLRELPSRFQQLFETVGKLGNAVSEILRNIPSAIGNLISAVLSINDFLKVKLLEFLGSLLAYFLWTILYDLFELEYDLETGEVVGEAKNPVSKYFLQKIVVEKPKYPYEDISLEVKQ